MTAFPRMKVLRLSHIFPNAVNTPGFKQPILKAYEQKTYYNKYVFSEIEI